MHLLMTCISCSILGFTVIGILLPIHSIWIFTNTISVNNHLTNLLKCLFLTSALLSLSCRSFFELMLFFSKEEFVEKPLKDILSSFQVTTITFCCSSWVACYSPKLLKCHKSSLLPNTKLNETPILTLLYLQECHCQLLRHRNVYLRHVKQIIKAGGPWEHPVLQGILKDTDLPSKEGALHSTLHSWCVMHTEETPWRLWERLTQTISPVSHMQLTGGLSDKSFAVWP